MKSFSESQETWLAHITCIPFLTLQILFPHGIFHLINSPRLNFLVPLVKGSPEAIWIGLPVIFLLVNIFFYFRKKSQLGLIIMSVCLLWLMFNAFTMSSINEYLKSFPWSSY